MEKIKYVDTREGLKSALQTKYDYIVITDKKLADSVSNVKDADETALKTVVIAAAGAALMWWNPIGWGAGLVAITAGGALTLSVAFLIAVLGGAIIWALKNDWKIVARGKIKLSDGTELTGEIILSPK